MKIVYFLMCVLFLPLAFAADLSITSTPQTAATVGIPYSYQIVASDGTATPLTYSLTTTPSGMSINTTGFISFLPVTSGNENVVIKVSNGTNQTTQSYVLNIAQNNALSMTVPLLGGSKQRRSNPRAFDDGHRDVYTEAKIVLKNTGTEKLTNFSFSSTIGNTFNVTFSNVPSFLEPNTEAIVTIKARVPEDLDAFFPDKTERKVALGEISLAAKSNNATLTTKQPVQMEVKNVLVIRDVHIVVKDRVKNVDENDRVENLKIRDQVRLEIDVENLFSTNDNEDIDLNNVVINIDTNNKMFDIDNQLDLRDVRANAIETGIISFFVEDDAQDGAYKITLEATGEDDNGALHGDRISFNLEVVRKQNEISIDKFTLSPEKVTCKTKEATLTVVLHNTGKSNEEKAAVKVESKELSYIQKRNPLSINRDDVVEQKFTFPLKRGRATIQIETFYDTDKLSATEGFVVDIPDCGGALQNIVEETKKEVNEELHKEEPAREKSIEKTPIEAMEEKELIPINVAYETRPQWVYPLLGLSVLGALGAVLFLFWILLKSE